jgi:hypothetical protein
MNEKEKYKNNRALLQKLVFGSKKWLQRALEGEFFLKQPLPHN